MSLRKDKAARLKLNVLDHTLRLIGKKSFDDLYVDEICDKVKISKVTLFKYFPQKEDILLYYFRVWCLRRTVELTEKPKEGMSGIYFLFDKLSEECEEHPGMVLSLIGYLTDLKRTPKPFPLKAEEKKFLFPEIKDIHQIEILSIDQLLERFALEAIFKKEVTKTTSTRDVTNLLNALFYGSIVSIHLHQLSPIKIHVRRMIDMAIKGIQ